MTDLEVYTRLVEKAEGRIVDLEKRLQVAQMYLDDLLTESGIVKTMPIGKVVRGPFSTNSGIVEHDDVEYELPKPGSLPAAVEVVLRQSKTPMTIKQIAGVLVKTGYQYTGKQRLYAAIFAALRRPKVFVRQDRGLYTVKKSSPE